jgi:hypothetical protein
MEKRTQLTAQERFERAADQFTGIGAPNYTRLPNEIFDVLMKHLTGNQFKVLLVVGKYTMDSNGLRGYCPATDLDQMQRYTSMKPRAIDEAIRDLREYGIILKKHFPDGKEYYRLRFLGEEEEEEGNIE